VERKHPGQLLFFIKRGKTSIFDPHPGKNDPHIRIPAGFPGPGWGKLCGENRLDLMAFGGLVARCISPLFWQTWQYSGLFSTGTEKEDFAGFSGIGLDSRRGKGARIGLICPQG